MSKHKILFFAGLITLGLLVVSVPFFAGYDNYMTRNFGGTMNIPVPENHRVINCTWKENNLWVLYENNLTCEQHFQEYSLYGIAEGKVTFTAPK